MDDPSRFHNSQGVALARQGRWTEAAVCFQEALRINPSSAQSHNNLANIFLFQGRYAEAIAHYQQSLQFLPDDPATCNNLSYAYQKAGKPVEAEAYAARALELQPNYAEAHNHLGIAIETQGRTEEACDHYREALRLRPEFPEALNNYGRQLRIQNRFDEAEACSQNALRLDPNLVESYVNLGHIYLQSGQYARARAICKDAMARRADLLEPYLIQALLEVKEGRLDEAMTFYDQALRIQPDNPESHFNRGMALLLKGDLREGWPEYEWRWRVKEAQALLIVIHSLTRPFWNGSPVAGKTVYVHAEQGMGDTIQFLRYLPMVKNLGASVIFGCPEPLIPLVKRCAGFDRIIPLGPDIPECDEHSPLMNLPRIFDTTLANIPAQIPYLFADEARVEQWRRELSGRPGWKIGIAWQGNPKHAQDAMRSIPLRCFAPLARVPGVQLFSLQKGLGSEQIAALARQFPLTDLGNRLDADGAFLDTAALMMNLDLVITSDTAVAHLAGALGRPVWTAIPFAPDWRWLLGRADSPWYPTLRLFRQSAVGRWDDVFERMAGELAEQMRKGPRMSPVMDVLKRPIEELHDRLQREQNANPRLTQPRSATASVLIEVAPGELLDKIAILEIKKERIKDAAKLANVLVEYETLSRARDRAVPASEEVAKLVGELTAVNLSLWQIEDDIRECERTRDFGQRFIELARSVYRNNDARASVKKRINELLGAKIVEEKSYAEYE